MIAWIAALGLAAPAVTAHLVIATPDPDALAESLEASAVAAGGHLQSRGHGAIELRVPPEAAASLIAAAESGGTALSRSYESTELGMALADVVARRVAREGMWDKYEEVLLTAAPKAVVAVERQIVDLIVQIEQLRAEERNLTERSARARITVAFQASERPPPRRGGSSSFAWLDTLDLAGVFDAIQWGSLGRRDGPAVVPEGFAALKGGGPARAASPDGVFVISRKARTPVPASLEFWKEAAAARMRDAGYEVLSTDVTDGRVTMTASAPTGSGDWIYRVDFEVDGKWVHLVESAGRVLDYEARQGAIEAALR